MLGIFIYTEITKKSKMQLFKKGDTSSSQGITNTVLASQSNARGVAPSLCFMFHLANGLDNSLLNIESGTGFLSLHCSNSDTSCGVVVNHSVILVPENILRRQERVLQDTDEGDEGALFNPVLVG